MSDLTVCPATWGSHGCDLELGHVGTHKCHSVENGWTEPCSELDQDTLQVRFAWEVSWSPWAKLGEG